MPSDDRKESRLRVLRGRNSAKLGLSAGTVLSAGHRLSLILTLMKIVVELLYSNWPTIE